MGLVNSVNQNITSVLIDCGFVDSNGDVLDIFTVEDFAPALQESLALWQDVIVAVGIAKSAKKGSTNANIRTMQIILNFWKEKLPGKPILKSFKQNMQRLACSFLSTYFFDFGCFVRLLHSVFRFFESLEHDFESRFEDGKISARIRQHHHHHHRPMNTTTTTITTTTTTPPK
jgi:hypothetical protein